jgi:hypothetical protein
MAQRGGLRPNAGRKLGSLSKSTIERAKRAEFEMSAARESGKKLAKDVLEEFMFLFAGIAATAQPIPAGMAVPAGKKPNPRTFEKYARLAVETAAALARYQSPTFKAVLTAEAPQPAPDPKMIEGKVLELPTDAMSGSRLYQRMVNGR